MSDDLAFALHLADVADAISLEHFRGDPHSRTKADGTIVTEADEAVERAMRDEIAATFPDDGVLGEEEGDASAGAERRWILDPIDGTSNYARGRPIWASLIALEVSGEIVVGVASAPALRERYEASRGGGARRNGEPIAVSKTHELADAHIAYTSYAHFEYLGHGEGWTKLVRSVNQARGFGDFWGHMLVAAGHMDLMAEPIVNPWDVAPVLVIVEEAGGRFTDLDGNRTIGGGSSLSSNGVLHDAALACFSN